MSNIISQLKNIAPHNGKAIEMLYPTPGIIFKKINRKNYEEGRQNFNTYYQFRPSAIVYCESATQLSEAFLIATRAGFAIRVRSGGHDHEGECSATGAVVLDLSKMKNVDYDKVSRLAEIEPGAKFEDLVQILYSYGVAIPHGTCPSVAIAGFISGGGWGPWTRKEGMCCESLEAVSIVLGNGEIAYLDRSTKRGTELLWAISGGGGMSFGIITKFYIRTFPLPADLLKFELNFRGRFRSMDVFKAWENIIQSENNPELTGSNIRIKAKNNCEKQNDECTIYGSFSDTSEQLKTKITLWFNALDLNEGMTEEILRYVVIRENGQQVVDPQFFKELYVDWELIGAARLKGGTPSPHKITSRVVVKEGLGDSGRKNLHASLNSSTLPSEQELKDAEIDCYATHNAISGQFYAGYTNGNNLSSFPYKERPYIIQYQAWWGKNQNKARFEKCLNSVLDWQQECRDRVFPETNGSFISFKDASIMTKHYFAESYERLKEIKDTWSNDPNNFLSSRKTII